MSERERARERESERERKTCERTKRESIVREKERERGGVFGGRGCCVGQRRDDKKAVRNGECVKRRTKLFARGNQQRCV